MRFNRSIIAFAFLAAISCSVDPAAEQEPAIERIPDTITIRAHSENLWNNTDALSVFDDEGQKVNFSTSHDNVPSATFSSSSWTGKAPVWAVFSNRKNDNACTAEGVMSVFIKASQTAKKKNCCPKEGDASVGRITGSPGSYDVEMKSIAAYVKVNITAGIVGKIIVSAVGSEALTGYVDVDYNKLIAAQEQWWAPTDGKSTETSASLAPSSGNNFEPGVYLVAILPHSYSKGLKLTALGDDGRAIASAVIGEEGVNLARGASVSAVIEIDTSAGYDGVQIEPVPFGSTLEFD